MRFITDVINVENSCEKKYIIPTYQRPYVWNKIQLDKILSDFWNAYFKDEKAYFIGNVITSEKDGIFELIDGQQRFITLWLIAYCFYKKDKKSSLGKFLQKGKDLRLGFSIRTQVEEYLKLLLEHETVYTEKFSETRIKEDEYLSLIAEAVTTIENMLDQFKYTPEKSREKFGDFIFSKVLFIENLSPQDTNLNKLFITLNNSGIQLEHTDILKANLLKNLKSKKSLYSEMWEACENMDDFFPYNVKYIFSGANWKSINLDSLSEFDKEIFQSSTIYSEIEDVKSSSYPLNEIMLINNDEIKINENSNNKSSGQKCRSIISFAQLLLHTYRIFLKRNNREDFALPFHSKNLLDIFKGLTEEVDIKDFINTLWKTRYVFDKHVIKWIEDEIDEEVLSISNVYIDKEGALKWDSLEKSDLSILQSVLYHTSNPNTQIWLSPFLYSLLYYEGNPINILENIDNRLSISLLEDKKTTFLLMDKGYDVAEELNFSDYLHKYLGTSFMHYWFQKLEYVLWKDWDRKDDKFRNYRITRKNSVEHVFPQNHEFKKKLDVDDDIHKNWLNSFGNLGLINVSQNSSYSHQDVKKKKVDFDNKNTYDSLKLAKIYKCVDFSDWGITEIINHQKEMIDKLKVHYKK